MSDDMGTESTALVVLAAGFGRRMGQQKLLLTDGNGVPVVRRTVTAACQAAVELPQSQVLLVCNPAFPGVTAACDDLPVRVLWNDRAEEGMSTSLRMGIRWADEGNFHRAVIVLADQPELAPAVLLDLVRTHIAHPDAWIVQPRYHGVPGHPVAFSRSTFAELQAVSGDEGGRSVIRAQHNHCVYVDVTTDPLPDLDTPADYRAFLQRSPH